MKVVSLSGAPHTTTTQNPCMLAQAPVSACPSRKRSRASPVVFVKDFDEDSLLKKRMTIPPCHAWLSDCGCVALVRLLESLLDCCCLHMVAQPAVMNALARVVCLASTNMEALKDAERVLVVLNRCFAVLQKKDARATAVKVAVAITNAALDAMAARLEVVGPHMVQHAVPFFYDMYVKWLPLMSSGTIKVRRALVSRFIAVLRLPEETFVQAKYNAGYVLRMFSTHAAFRGLQATLPALLQMAGSTSIADLRDIAMGGIANILCNPLPCSQLTSARQCAELVRVCVTVLSVSAWTPEARSHDNDAVCAHAAVCLSYAITQDKDKDKGAQTNPTAQQLLNNARFMNALHMMAHPAYGCVPSQFRHFFLQFLQLLVPADAELAAARQQAVTAYLCTPTAATEWKHVDDPVCCCICLAHVTTTTVYTHGTCKHAYHPQCLAKWLVQKDSCPTCRMPVLEIA